MPSTTITQPLLDQARAGQQEPLIRAILDILKRALTASRVPAQEVEDLRQGRLLTILQKLIDGRVEPGREDGYVWRSGETIAISFFRKNRRKMLSLDTMQEIEEVPPSSRDTATREAHLATQVEMLREVLRGKDLSSEESQLLHDVYVKGIGIGALAEEELRQNPEIRKGRNAGTQRTLSQARNAVDQRLTRARYKLELALRRRLS